MAVQQQQIALDVALGQLVQALTPATTEWDKRKRLVGEHCQLLSRQLNSPHPIWISPFGSSLSGLCLADSDVDLGLFGRFNGCQLENLRPHQQQSLLKLVLKAIQQAKLAKHKVQGIWGARVPVLKYTCTLSGLDCDISLQGTGALLKAHVIQILNRTCSKLSGLYRLVKLWAQAHDLNDASRSTFNSTSLLYMTIFYLQNQQLLPPMRELVPPHLLSQPTERLLQGSNKALWEDDRNLQQLLDAVELRAFAWQRQQQQRDPRLDELLCGFWEMWSSRLSEWALHQHRDMHADLWHGTWTRGSFPKPYTFSIQDPFDANDCPARAIGSSTNTNGGTAAFIAYMFSSSAKIMQRYSHNCKHAAAEAAASQGQPDTEGQQLYGSSHGSSSSWPGSDTAESAQHTMQHELCKVLAWLFGPQAVLLLGSEHHRHYHHQQFSSATSAGYKWAQHPFQASLVAALQQKQRQCSSHQLLTWLVMQLGAALDPHRNLLCLQHLGLLSKQSLAAAHAMRNEHAAARSMRDNAAAADPAVGTAPATGSVQPDLQSQQLLATAAAQQQQYVVLLHGPALSRADWQLTELKQSLEADLSQAAYKLRQQPDKQQTPKRQPKRVKDTVQRCMSQVLARLQVLEQQAGAPSQRSSNSAGGGSGSSSSVRYGLMAVLQQHGFTPLLEQWTFIRDGVLWEHLLPAADILGEPEDSDVTKTAAVGVAPESSGSSHAAGINVKQNSTRTLPEAQPLQPSDASSSRTINRSTISTGAINSSTVSSSASNSHAAISSGNCGSRQGLLLLKLLNSSCPVAGLKALYQRVNSASWLQLQTAAGAVTQPAAEALAAAKAAANSWTWFTCDCERPGRQQGEGLQQHSSTESSAAAGLDSGNAQWYVTAHLPPVLVVQRNGSTCSVQELVPATNVRELLRVSGPMVPQCPEFTHRVGARAALLWLERQPRVVDAISAVLTHRQPGQQQPESQQMQLAETQLLQSNAGMHSSSAELAAIQSHEFHKLQKQGTMEKCVNVRVVKAPTQPPQQAGALAVAADAAAKGLSSLHGQCSGTNAGQQQQSKASAGTSIAAPSLAAHLNGLTLQSPGEHPHTPSNQARDHMVAAAGGTGMQAPACEADAAARAKAEHAYNRRLGQLRDQIRAAERRLQQKELQLVQDEELLAELQQEEQAALATAGVGSSSDSSSCKSAELNGMLLLDLALQQSTQGMLKELHHDLNNTKCKVQAGREAIRQLKINLPILQQEAAAVASGGVDAFIQQQQQQQQREQADGQRVLPQQQQQQPQQQPISRSKHKARRGRLRQNLHSNDKAAARLATAAAAGL